MKKSKSISGVPWHIETLKMSEDDERRHKSRCIYYDAGSCDINIKCYGSTTCKHYKEKPREEVQEKPKPIIDNNKSSVPNTRLMGTFAIQNIESGEIICHNVGVDISVNNELVTIIKYRNQNSVFEYGGIKYKIISKYLYYKTQK